MEEGLGRISSALADVLHDGIIKCRAGWSDEGRQSDYKKKIHYHKVPNLGKRGEEFIVNVEYFAHYYLRKKHIHSYNTIYHAK
jgi:hypothetical protein